MGSSGPRETMEQRVTFYRLAMTLTVPITVADEDLGAAQITKRCWPRKAENNGFVHVFLTTTEVASSNDVFFSHTSDHQLSFQPTVIQPQKGIPYHLSKLFFEICVTVLF